MSTVISQGLRSTKLVSQGYVSGVVILAQFVLRAARGRFDIVAAPCRFVVRALRGRFAVGGE